MNERVCSQQRLTILVIAILCPVYLLTAAFLGDLNVTAWSIAVVLAVPLIWLTAVDLHHKEIPDLATLMVAGVGLGLSSDSLNVGVMNVLVGLAVTVVLGGGGHIAWRRTGREWLGLGDAKLIGAGTILVGIEQLWVMMLLACCGGIGVALLGRGKEDKREVPFGPFLAYAIYVTHLSSGPVA